MPKTLYDKIWNDHLVDQQDDGTALLFVDRHLVHEQDAYLQKVEPYHRLVDQLSGHSKFYRKVF